MKNLSTRILTKQEISEILHELGLRRRNKWQATRRNKVIFRLAACCGLRASEIANLNIKDVHLGIARPYIHVVNGKGNKSRHVPLWWDKGTLADLTHWIGERMSAHEASPQDPVVINTRGEWFGTRMNRVEIRKRFRWVCSQTGRQATTHDGRHTFASHAIHGGRSLMEVRDALGHSNISTTSIYAHVCVDPDNEPDDIFDL